MPQCFPDLIAEVNYDDVCRTGKSNKDLHKVLKLFCY